MKAPITFLCQRAFKNVIYLDDCCLTNPPSQARLKTLATAWLLEMLGYLINWKKSSAHPSPEEEFLGFEVDTSQLMIFLPQGKINKILQLYADLVQRKQCSLRSLSSLIAKLQNASTARSPSFLPYANDEHRGPGEIFSQLRGLCRPPKE